jgi:hypothetical protein
MASARRGGSRSRWGAKAGLSRSTPQACKDLIRVVRLVFLRAGIESLQLTTEKNRHASPQGRCLFFSDFLPNAGLAKGAWSRVCPA